MSDPPLLTKREFLMMYAMAHGADVFTAAEAVASTAIEHPEWDLTETKTWDEWETGQ